MKKTLCQQGKGEPNPPFSLPFKFQIVTVKLPSYSRKEDKEIGGDDGGGDNAYGVRYCGIAGTGYMEELAFKTHHVANCGTG